MDLNSLCKQLQKANPIQTVELLHTDGLLEKLTDYETLRDNPELFVDMNAAMLNPVVRHFVYRKGLIIDALTTAYMYARMKPGTMSPNILKWASEQTYHVVCDARYVLVFLDLDIYAYILKYNREQSGTVTVNIAGGIPLTMDVTSMFTDEKLRSWYDAYVQFLPKTKDNVKDEIYYSEDYRRFWKFLEKKFGEPESVVDLFHIYVDFYFSSHPIATLKEHAGYTGGWEDWLYGDDTRDGFYEDLELMRRAVSARQAGETVIYHNVITSHRTGTTKKVKLLVSELLDRRRLALFAEGFQAYEHKLAEYEADNDKEYNWDPEYVAWLKKFPGDDLRDLISVCKNAPTPYILVAKHALYERQVDVQDVIAKLPTHWESLSDTEIIHLVDIIMGKEG